MTTLFDLKSVAETDAWCRGHHVPLEPGRGFPCSPAVSPGAGETGASKKKYNRGEIFFADT
jgi:hypothetical protein